VQELFKTDVMRPGQWAGVQELFKTDEAWAVGRSAGTI